MLLSTSNQSGWRYGYKANYSTSPQWMKDHWVYTLVDILVSISITIASLTYQQMITSIPIYCCICKSLYRGHCAQQLVTLHATYIYSEKLILATQEMHGVTLMFFAETIPSVANSDKHLCKKTQAHHWRYKHIIPSTKCTVPCEPNSTNTNSLKWGFIWGSFIGMWEETSGSQLVVIAIPVGTTWSMKCKSIILNLTIKKIVWYTT